MSKTNNYDLNVWDRLSHETNGARTGGWAITPYRMGYDILGNLSTGDYVPELIIVLTPDEAKDLTLGWGPDLGGDYAEDEDFFIDCQGFLETYKNIPTRVRSLIMALPEYDLHPPSEESEEEEEEDDDIVFELSQSERDQIKAILGLDQQSVAWYNREI